MAYTTVSVRTETMERLRKYRKATHRSLDEVLNDLMDDTAPDDLLREVERRLRVEPDIPGEQVRARLDPGWTGRA